METVALEEAIEAPENSDGPEDMMEREEEAHRLRLALERLSSNHRRGSGPEVLQRPHGAGNRQGR